MAHRGFSIKVDQSNRHSVTQQSGGSFSHQTLPQDVNIAKLALQLNGSIGSGSLDNRSHPHWTMECAGDGDVVTGEIVSSVCLSFFP